MDLAWLVVGWWHFRLVTEVVTGCTRCLKKSHMARRGGFEKGEGPREEAAMVGQGERKKARSRSPVG